MHVGVYEVIMTFTKVKQQEERLVNSENLAETEMKKSQYNLLHFGVSHLQS